MGYPLSFYHPIRDGAVALHLARHRLGASATDAALIERCVAVRETRRSCQMSKVQLEAFLARMNAVLANDDLRRYIDGGNAADLERGIAAVGA